MRTRLYGYFAHGNLGDEAVREAWMRAVPLLRDSTVQRPPRLPLRRAVTLFAGGLLQDESSLRSLLFYTTAVRTAALRGPAALAAVGVDVHSGPGKLLLSLAVRGADYVSARDPESCLQLAKAGASAHQARDVALTLDPPRYRGDGAILVNLTPAVPKPIVREVLHSAGQCAKGLRTTVRGLVMAREEDERAITGLPVFRPSDPAELMRALANAPLVYTARLHAAELALVVGAPFVAIPTSHKLRAFLGLVDRDLPRPIPCVPDERPAEWLHGDAWRRALERAKERLVDEAWTGVEDVHRWLRNVA